MNFFSNAWNWIKDTAVPWVADNLLGIGDVATNTASVALQNQIAQDNFNASEKWNQLNYANQVAQQEYDRWRQLHTWAREDDAVQRRALDLEKAGLSKTLAAGSAANAGSIVSQTAPQRGYTPKDASPMEQLAQMELMNNLKLKKQESDLRQIDLDTKRHDLFINEKAGTTSHDNSNYAQIMRFLAGTLDLDMNKYGDTVGAIIESLLTDILDNITGNDGDSTVEDQQKFNLRDIDLSSVSEKTQDFLIELEMLQRKFERDRTPVGAYSTDTKREPLTGQGYSGGGGSSW